MTDTFTLASGFKDDSRKRAADLERNLFREYDRAIDKFDKDIANLKGIVAELGSDVTPGQLAKLKRWQTLRNKAIIELDRYSQAAGKQIDQQLVEEARRGVADADRLLKADSGGKVVLAPGINTGAVEFAINNFASTGSTTMAGLSGDALEMMQNEIIQGAINGTGDEQIVRNIEKKLKGDYSKARIAATVRTEQMRSYRQATQAAYQGMAHLLRGMRWVSGRSGTCAACLAMDGQVFPMDEVPYHFHVACRCVMVPVTHDSDYKHESGEEWLKREGTEEEEKAKKRTLGEQSLKDIRSGKLNLKDFLGYRTDRVYGTSVQAVSRRKALFQHDNPIEPPNAGWSIPGQGRGQGELGSGITQGPAASDGEVITLPAKIDKGPITDTVPLGENISSVFKGVQKFPKAADMKKLVVDTKDAIKELNKIHGIPEGSRPFTMYYNEGWNSGEYASYTQYLKDPTTGKWLRDADGNMIQGLVPHNIGISTISGNVRSAISHEFGHYVDEQVLGRIFNPKGDYSEGFGSSSGDPRMEAWKDAVKNSQAYKNIEHRLAKADPSDIPASDLEYMLKTHELFARTYDQWVAYKGGDPKRIDLLDATPRDWQWEKEDFKDIELALDRLFVDTGLMKDTAPSNSSTPTPKTTIKDYDPPTDKKQVEKIISKAHADGIINDATAASLRKYTKFGQMDRINKRLTDTFEGKNIDLGGILTQKKKPVVDTSGNGAKLIEYDLPTDKKQVEQVIQKALDAGVIDDATAASLRKYTKFGQMDKINKKLTDTITGDVDLSGILNRKTKNISTKGDGSTTGDGNTTGSGKLTDFESIKNKQDVERVIQRAQDSGLINDADAAALRKYTKFGQLDRINKKLQETFASKDPNYSLDFSGILTKTDQAPTPTPKAKEVVRTKEDILAERERLMNDPDWALVRREVGKGASFGSRDYEGALQDYQARARKLQLEAQLHDFPPGSFEYKIIDKLLKTDLSKENNTTSIGKELRVEALNRLREGKTPKEFNPNKLQRKDYRYYHKKMQELESLPKNSKKYATRKRALDEFIDMVRYKETPEMQRKAVMDLIQVLRPYGGTAKHETSRGHDNSLNDIVNAANQRIPSDWLLESTAATPIRVHETERAYFLREPDADNVLVSRRRDRTGHQNSMESVMVHEFGHQMERLYPRIQSLEKQFYNRRTKGEKFQQIYPGHPEYSHEVAKLDDFLNSYMGKDYGERAYELLTMAQQQFTLPADRTNGGGEAVDKTHIEDPDFIEWWIGVILGV